MPPSSAIVAGGDYVPGHEGIKAWDRTTGFDTNA